MFLFPRVFSMTTAVNGFDRHCLSRTGLDIISRRSVALFWKLSTARDQGMMPNHHNYKSGPPSDTAPTSDLVCLFSSAALSSKLASYPCYVRLSMLDKRHRTILRPSVSSSSTFGEDLLEKRLCAVRHCLDGHSAAFLLGLRGAYAGRQILRVDTVLAH